MPAIRLATVEDISDLVRMRWDFSQEENPQHSVDYEEFYPVCSAFLRKALEQPIRFNGGRNRWGYLKSKQR
ncbi:hypothetical protein ACTID9_05725 [Brevibacillus fluminis]|uniref:hypothetical protein n=1 Tax=Brevibacillus fluminis TaxID=511487 RepID=UPI003F8AF01B